MIQQEFTLPYRLARMAVVCIVSLFELTILAAFVVMLLAWAGPLSEPLRNVVYGW